MFCCSLDDVMSKTLLPPYQEFINVVYEKGEPLAGEQITTNIYVFKDGKCTGFLTADPELQRLQQQKEADFIKQQEEARRIEEENKKKEAEIIKKESEIMKKMNEKKKKQQPAAQTQQEQPSQPKEVSQPKETPKVALLCQTCKSSSNLKQCGNCFKVAYCSRECQRIDWVHHKPICKK
uniref:MYND-type domain-containing protein n=1 Tax=Arcella intermedia TaxID=1963864 RepID=A0A6B2LKR4_9EUKA